MTIGDKKSMTKKAYLALQRTQRSTNGFNTGTRDMKSNKYPSRQKIKLDTMKQSW